jgi:uncharacterized membrane protein AbrB (regulator of aidB expression)
MKDRRMRFITATGMLVFLVMAATAVWNLKRAGEVPMVAGMIGYVVGGASGFLAGLDWMRQSRKDGCNGRDA